MPDRQGDDQDGRINPMADELAGGAGGGQKSRPPSLSGIFHGGVTPLRQDGP